MALTDKTLSSLLQQATITDHEEVLKACNAALKTSQNDVEVLHLRAVALLKLERYEDALRILNTEDQQLQERTQFEKAYALYRTGRLEEAKAISRGVTSAIGAKHVLAQAYYRSEEFESAFDIYDSIFKSDSARSDNENDLTINKIATLAQVQWVKQGTNFDRLSKNGHSTDIYETSYNSACVLIAVGELEQAKTLLRLAEDLCQQNDELSGDEKIAEIASIHIQLLYVLLRLGETEEANRIASAISTDSITDNATKKVADNNLATIASAKGNPFLDRYLVNSSADLPDADRLFNYQASQLRENDLILDLNAQKPQAVITATDSVLTSTHPPTSPHVNSLSALNAAAHAQGDPVKLGLGRVLPLLENRPFDAGLIITIVQIYVFLKKLGSAVQTLDTFLAKLAESSEPSHQGLRYAPGLIALQIALYQSQDRKSHVEDAFAKAALYWLHEADPPITLLQKAGASLLDSESQEHRALAREVFNQLHTMEPQSYFITAGFIASHASTSLDFITEDDLTQLPPIEEQIKGIDITALEDAGIPSLPNESFARKRSIKESTKPVKKRNRHSRLPKEYDPSKKPDPERWLPLRDRSSYKPPKKKGKKRDPEKDRTQGGIITEKPGEKENELVKGNEKSTGGGGSRPKGKKKGKK